MIEEKANIAPKIKTGGQKPEQSTIAEKREQTTAPG
jgi:hypothetical protein